MFLHRGTSIRSEGRFSCYLLRKMNYTRLYQDEGLRMSERNSRVFILVPCQDKSDNAQSKMAYSSYNTDPLHQLSRKPLE
jgi:hypothetical protein